jgi:hypothetical protein
VECEWNCKAAGILFFCLHPFAHLVIFPRRLLHPSIEDGVSYSLVLGRVITETSFPVFLLHRVWTVFHVKKKMQFDVLTTEMFKFL